MPLPAESTASLGLLISSGLWSASAPFRRGLHQWTRCLWDRPTLPSIDGRHPDLHDERHAHCLCGATRAGWWCMKAWSAIAAGMLFGAGLALSGMSDPLKVLGFLDVSGDWIPDLALVMGGALIVSLVSTPWVLKHAAPRFASQFHVPNTSQHRSTTRAWRHAFWSWLGTVRVLSRGRQL